MAGTKLTTVSVIELANGAITLAAEEVAKWAPQDTNARGVVVANDRHKVRIMHGDTPVEYTFSLYVQRAPLDEGEAERIEANAAERKEAKAAKDLAEQEKRDREIAAAVRMTRDVAFDAMRQATAQAQETAKAIETLKAFGVDVAKLQPTKAAGKK